MTQSDPRPGDAWPPLLQLEHQLSAALEGAERLHLRAGRCGHACLAHQRLQSVHRDLARMREEHRRDVAELSEELRHLRSELKAREAQLRLAQFRHNEALGRLGSVFQECGTVSQQLRREVVLLRGNVARGIRVAFQRGRGGAELKALDEVERLRRMPVAAELQVRDEQVKQLALELASLSQDANAEQIRMEQRLKRESERRLQELSEEREQHKQNESLIGSKVFKATALGADQGGGSADRARGLEPLKRKSGRNEKNPHAGHHQQQEHAHRDEQVEGKEGANATELLDEGPRLSVDASGLDGVGASTSETRYATSLGCPKGDSCIPEGRESDYHHVADIQESVRRATFQLEIALSLLYEDDGEGNNGKVIPGLTDPEGLS